MMDVFKLLYRFVLEHWEMSQKWLSFSHLKDGKMFHSFRNDISVSLYIRVSSRHNPVSFVPKSLLDVYLIYATLCRADWILLL